MADSSREAGPGSNHPDPTPPHEPVLLHRCLELLAPALTRPAAIALDATVGLGGHAAALLEAHRELALIGLDRDPQALELAGRRLAAFGTRARLVHARFDQLTSVLDELDVDELHGALFDFGVSSLQLDDPARGFAYSRDAPLDMRMDPTAGPTAAEILNTYAAGELTRVLREYGEERFARRIATAIVDRRAQQPFRTSADLVELVYQAVPAPARRTGGHPAKRTFQALRIEVNGELAAIRSAVSAAGEVLAEGGRMVTLSYHSLEDRIVKRECGELTSSRTPAELPVELPGHGPRFRWLTRGTETASDAEVRVNPRAGSVRLRAVERIAPRGSL